MAVKRKPSSKSTPARKSSDTKSANRPQAKGTPRSIPAPTKRSSAPKPSGVQKTAANTTPPKLKTPDAIDLLVDDHMAADAIFKKYEKLMKADAPGSQRQSLALEVCGMLKVHTRIEEEIFYPTVRSAGIDKDKLDEAAIEHASAKDLIKQIESMNPGDDYFDAKVKVLGEYIAHHVIEEHTEMFPKCRRLKIDLVALRQRLEARKNELASGMTASAGAARDTGLLSKVRDAVTSE